MRQKLIDARKKKGFKQSEIAEKLNISRSFYSFVEAGKRNPSLKTLNELLEILELEFQDFQVQTK